jgi:FKBP-type peptidyl-prolyl cis-trans isomerase 2
MTNEKVLTSDKETNKKINKKDFIEITFTGKVKDGEVFDSNIPEEVKKLNPNVPDEKITPFIFCVGEQMFLDAIDEFLIGKELKEYKIDLTPEKAFGKRNPSLIRIIPLRIFREKNANPYPGMVFNFDGQIGKILSVSGGRVITDFNNPIAGKDVIYTINVKRKIIDLNEKVKALMDFFFRKQFDFEVNEKNKKLIIKADKNFKNFIELFKEKFKEILDFETEVIEIKGK